jgi:hypothetical protein
MGLLPKENQCISSSDLVGVYALIPSQTESPGEPPMRFERLYLLQCNLIKRRCSGFWASIPEKQTHASGRVFMTYDQPGWPKVTPSSEQKYSIELDPAGRKLEVDVRGGRLVYSHTYEDERSYGEAPCTYSW